jgi:phage I-like protein
MRARAANGHCARLMVRNGHHLGLIALCAAAHGETPLATCAALLADDAAAKKWLQLIPVGTFKPIDGREAWHLRDAEKVIAASKPFLPANIDFDHGSDTAGSSAAAGWIEELAPHGPNNEPGIWGRVEWNSDGADALANKRYRFISPVFAHNDKTRDVTAFVRASLVNNPALRQLKALASVQPQENNLDALKKIAAALGLPDTATLDDILTAITGLTSGSKATAASLTSIATAAGLTLADNKIGETEVTAICAKLKVPAANDGTEVALLRSQVNELSGKLNTALLTQQGVSAETEVEKAIASGKLVPALKDWGLALCKSDPEKFKTYVGAAPTVLSSGRLAPQGAAAGDLTDAELAVCSQLGLKPEDFKAQKALGRKEKN